MSQDRSAYSDENQRIFTEPNLAATHYALLGLAPSASVQEIRRAYRELSKLYHPDTTDLPATIAIQKFQQLNEAYTTLSSPKRRLTYDQKIGFSRIHVMQSPQNSHRTVSQTRSDKITSTYLDPSDRPLSPGELFALFLLGVTFVACLVLAIIVGLTRGETILHPSLMLPAIVQPAVTPANGQDTQQELLPSDQNTRQELLPPVDQAQDSSAND